MNKEQVLVKIIEEVSRGELIFPTNMAGALRLQQALNDPNCHLEAAAELVVAEPLVAARLVAIANSVAYTRFGGRVSNVRSAVNLLGFNSLRALVAAIVIKQFSLALDDPRIRNMSDQLWKHTVSVSVIAKITAREMACAEPETALFAGIVHELDSFYLLSCLQEHPNVLEVVASPEAVAMRPRLIDMILGALKIPRIVASAVSTARTEVLQNQPQSVAHLLAVSEVLANPSTPLSEHNHREHDSGRKEILESTVFREILKSNKDQIDALSAALLG